MKSDSIVWYGANIRDIEEFCGSAAKAKWGDLKLNGEEVSIGSKIVKSGKDFEVIPEGEF